jgi:Kef-type K+ transport system membrane component KefB
MQSTELGLIVLQMGATEPPPYLVDCSHAADEVEPSMSLSNSDATHLLLAFLLLLLAAHSLGFLFARLRQPRVAGEILGGLLLGPTVFGLLLPDWQRAAFSDGKATQAGLGVVYQLGLLLLMYCSGAELRSILAPRESRATIGIALLGNLVPFLAGLAFLKVYDTDRFLGTAHHPTAFMLVFALAMAITSIPVIARIMADLGILGTRFARIVLSVAVLEDLLVYVVLNVTLALVAPPHADAFTLPDLMGIQPASAIGNGYYVACTLALFAVAAVLGPGFVQRLAGLRGNLLHRSSPLAFQLVLLLGLTTLTAVLGVSPIFGALVAGILAGDLRDEAEEARHTVQRFAYAFFVPLYFAVVGMRLDLARHFEPVFFLVLLAFACLVKAGSCYAGARLAGEGRRGAWNLAVALNARGGPGIVLASVALDAGIVDEGFYTSLVMLALITSVLAGSWLQVALRRREGLLGEDRAARQPRARSAS